MLARKNVLKLINNSSDTQARNNCLRCAANGSDFNGSLLCILGYRQKAVSVPIYNELIKVPCPAVECPKPTTDAQTRRIIKENFLKGRTY
jgi:hypothetical protein